MNLQLTEGGAGQVTRWVTETILAQDDLKKRVAIIKHFVSIAEVCQLLRFAKARASSADFLRHPYRSAASR
jgi:hypothetical protein